MLFSLKIIEAVDNIIVLTYQYITNVISFLYNTAELLVKLLTKL